MKKLLITCGLALLSMQNVAAQTEDSWIPQQVGVGVGIGTTGIVIDASTTINRWFGVRAGVDIMPKFKVNTDLDLDFEEGVQLAYPSGIPDNIEVQGKLSNTTFHFLIDVYPFKGSSFHATTGFYAGGKELISVYNKEAGVLQGVYDWNIANPGAQIGAELGDYFIAPDKNGNLKATIEVGGFRPYLGIGFGRAVPRNRIGCQFDLGVQFWGSPKVYAPVYDTNTGDYHKQQLTDDHAGGDGGDVIKTISKISVYPTLNFRLVGRIL